MAKQQKFDAVLFDLDGTILDTTDFIIKAFKYSLRFHLNKKVTLTEVRNIAGLPLDECYRIVTGLKEVDHLTKSHHDFQAKNLSMVKTFPNTLKTLQALKKAGIAVAAVTTRCGHVETALQAVGIYDYFKFIITPNEVKETKPHPKPLLRALELLSVNPEKALMIGDSPVDIQAGKNAKVKTVAALYGVHGKKLLKENPDYVIDDISQTLPIIFATIK